MTVHYTLPLVLLLMSVPALALAQSSTEQARATAGEPASLPQRLTLVDVPLPMGKATQLFDGHSLTGWMPWLGYADPAITYRATSLDKPIGISRDGAVRPNAPALPTRLLTRCSATSAYGHLAVSAAISLGPSPRMPPHAC